MKAGRLDKWVQIEKGTETNTSGVISIAWATFANVWASVAPLHGREYYDAQQVVADVTHKICMRYVSGVTAKMRVRLGSRYFAIEAPPINVEERNEELVLMCKETET